MRRLRLRLRFRSIHSSDGGVAAADERRGITRQEYSGDMPVSGELFVVVLMPLRGVSHFLLEVIVATIHYKTLLFDIT